MAVSSIDALKSILNTAQRLRSVCKSTACDTPALFQDLPESSNVFPPPQPIIALLVSTGVPHDVANKISGVFIRTVERYRETVSQEYLKVCSLGSFSDTTRQQLLASFLKLYESKLKLWTEDTLEKSHSFHNCPQGSRATLPAKDRKKTFNHSYVEVLERYFDGNPFPSRADKVFLAERSGMSYQQIHVWFQNRRSRTKQAHDNQNVSFASLVIGEDDCVSISSRSSSLTFVNEMHAFDMEPPAYGFPAPYPPPISPDKDPFPCCFGDFSCFPKICWPRRPAPRQREPIEPDMSTLCLAFAGLRLGDAAQTLQKMSNRTRKGLQVSSKESGCDVTSPYTVRPLRAPLMSLIRNFASRVVHRSGKPSDGAQKSPRSVVATPVIKCGAQSAPRKTRCRQTPTSRGSVISADQNSAPSAHSPAGLISPSAHNSSVTSARASSTDQTSKIKKSTKKSSSSRRVPAASTSRRSKGRSAPTVQAIEPSSEPSTSHPSPTASVESLPSLSYSSGSSSASSYSHSPATSFASLSDDGFLPSLDPYLPSNSSLTLPPAQGHFDDFPPPMFASSGEIPFDFSKGPLDLTFNLGLPTYPSYSESFDSISRGLQSSPDFAPPALTLDLPSFAV